ncbi:MAG: hypothetical protein PW786_00395 [Arachidicoccus sp.]|nr:hypothetical protein [Arachidicoccus sp.]
MEPKDILVRFIRKSYRLIMRGKFANLSCEINRQHSNQIIYESLMHNGPLMISRFGTVELNAVNNYLCIISTKPYYRKIWKYISDNTHTPWWYSEHFKFLEVNAGVFPQGKETATKFAERYLEDIPFIDILGSFQYYEKFMPLNPTVQRLHLETLYPFFVDNPWTIALKNKKVLVIHPFEESIKYQYNRRDKLFENKNILPDFQLITFKPIQSAAEMKVPFNDWFEALNFMKEKIEKIDFDICLLGCGAYGLPLAAHIKRMGKKAVHLGGGLQLIFGIKGKRWDNPNYGIEEFKQYEGLMSKPYQSLYNEFWIRPLPENTPSTADKIENATYW